MPFDVLISVINSPLANDHDQKKKKLKALNKWGQSTGQAGIYGLILDKLEDKSHSPNLIYNPIKGLALTLALL